MARRAVKDTVLYEPVAPDTMVPRKVFAGDLVPDVLIEAEGSESGALRDEGSTNLVGRGAPQYKDNQGLSVREQLELRGQDTSDENVEAHTVGGAAVQRRAQQQQKAKAPVDPQKVDPKTAPASPTSQSSQPSGPPQPQQQQQG